jgi:hypothetical protein
MNWERGLFRLWLILSGLWIAFWAALVVIDTNPFEPKSTYAIEGPSKDKYEVSAPRSTSNEEIVAFVKSHPRTDCAQDQKGTVVRPSNEA